MTPEEEEALEVWMRSMVSTKRDKLWAQVKHLKRKLAIEHPELSEQDLDDMARMQLKLGV